MNATTGTPGGRRRWQRVWRVGLAALAVLALAVAGIRLVSPPVAHATPTDITTCDYATLANAITTAASGDTLRFDCNGVIYFDSAHGGGGAITITKTLTITGNGHSVTLDGGGSVRMFSVQSGGSLALNGLTVTHGRAVYGGGIYNATGGTLTITNSAISDNVATGFLGFGNGGGGGVYSSGTLTITNSTFSDNVASGGGGGGIANTSGAVTITNSTISGNVALGYNSAFDGSDGGGIESSFGTATITYSTVVGNEAAYGSGLYNYTATMNVANSIAANNTTPVDHRLFNCGNFFSGVFHDGGYNLMNASYDGCGFTEPTDVLTATPGLGSLAYNGGPTKTIALLFGSPAIDQIPSGVNSCGTTIKTDQRGASRPQWGKCDIGAFEYVYGVKLLYNASKAKQSGSAIPIKVQLTNTSGVNVSAADITLRVTGIKNLATGHVTPLSGVFKFEEASDQGPMYLFVLKTTGYATGSYALLFTATGDPMTHRATLVIR